MRAAPVGTGVHKHPHTLHGAQLKIACGQTAGLLGRNGMGKSTLIRTLLGPVAQRDGHITLFASTLRASSRTRSSASPWPMGPRGAACSRQGGISTLIVDRDYRRVLAHADQALVLQKGQVVLQGAAEDVAGSAALATYLGV